MYLGQSADLHLGHSPDLVCVYSRDCYNRIDAIAYQDDVIDVSRDHDIL